MNSKTCLKWSTSTRIAALLLLPGCLPGLVDTAQAATLVSGNISGTWNKAGSPYIVIDNCTVPSGQALVIQPGVTVIIGSNLTVTVNGRISAEGSPAERIRVKGPQPTVYWNAIQIVHGDGSQSDFTHCDFSEGQTALYLNIGSQNATMQTKIANCSFGNCSTCVYGYSHGYGYTPNYYTTIYLQPQLNPSITNCRFTNSVNGCWFYMDGTAFWDWYHVNQLYARGYASPCIANCIFESISAKGIFLQAGSVAGTSYPTVVNSLFIQNGKGQEVSDPYDLNLRNCIFQGCTNAVTRAGSLSSQVGYNCFFSNRTNFVGYPAAYGQIVMVNNNGTPCDVAFNIFQSPLFCETTNYTLSASSPCIDAGDPAAAYLDNCFASAACQIGSLGTTVSDIGACGGRYACDWLATTSSNFSVAVQKYVGVTINPVAPGRYRLEYTSDLTNGSWVQATNVALLSTPYTYIDYASPTTGKRFYRAVLVP